MTLRTISSACHRKFLSGVHGANEPVYLTGAIGDGLLYGFLCKLYEGSACVVAPVADGLLLRWEFNTMF